MGNRIEIINQRENADKKREEMQTERDTERRYIEGEYSQGEKEPERKRKRGMVLEREHKRRVEGDGSSATTRKKREKGKEFQKANFLTGEEDECRAIRGRIPLRLAHVTGRAAAFCIPCVRVVERCEQSIGVDLGRKPYGCIIESAHAGLLFRALCRHLCRRFSRFYCHSLSLSSPCSQFGYMGRLVE